MEFRHKFLLVNFLLLIFIYFIIRLSLFITYYDYFATLDFSSICFAFTDGLRFDISMIAATFALPFFLLTLPIKKKTYIKIITVLISIVSLFTLLLLIGDLLYFDFVKRHLGSDLFVSFNDMGFVFNIAIKQYWYLLIIILTFFVFYLKLLFKIIDKKFYVKKIKIWKEILYQISFVLLLIIAIRGGFGTKPINIINAFSIPKTQYGNLVLNGVFCCVKTSNKKVSVHKYFKDSLAFSKTMEIIKDKNEIIPDKNYPLCKKRSVFISDSLKSRGFNIVIFLLESWTPEFIDSYGHKSYKVTPNFDKLANNGLKFVNAYANGDRSIYGITATLLSIPQPLGMNYLGTGLELNNLFRIGKIFKKEGYKTIFAQTSKRGSFRLNVIAKALGFEEYYGKEDYRIIYNYTTNKEPYFGWDYEALMFLERRLSKIKSPFFAYLFTGTTHQAYVLPDKKFEKYPHQSNGINGFLNTLYYSDWSLGRFFEAAKKENWFKKTIFIFVADHTSKFVGSSIKDRFHIPLLIYCPALFNGKEIKKMVAQTDIPSTLFDILGFKELYAGIGKSVFSLSGKSYIVARKGLNMMITDTNASLLLNQGKIIEEEFYKKIDSIKYSKKLKRNLLYIEQTIFETIKRNKFYPE